MNRVSIVITLALASLAACKKKAEQAAPTPSPAPTPVAAKTTDAGPATPTPTPDAAAAPASCATLPAVVAGVEGAEIREADLDGDGTVDKMIPTAEGNSGRGSMDWQIFLMKGACATPLGTIEDAESLEDLGLASKGIAAQRYTTAYNRGRTASLVAWDGTAWVTFANGDCGAERDGEDVQTVCSGSIDAAAAAKLCVTAKGATPTVDADGDGIADQLLALGDGTDEQPLMSKQLLIITHAGCGRVAGLLPHGVVSIGKPGDATHPPELAIHLAQSAGAGDIDWKGVVDKGVWTETGSRTCHGDKCEKWMAPAATVDRDDSGGDGESGDKRE